VKGQGPGTRTQPVLEKQQLGETGAGAAGGAQPWRDLLDALRFGQAASIVVHKRRSQGHPFRVTEE